MGLAPCLIPILRSPGSREKTASTVFPEVVGAEAQPILASPVMMHPAMVAAAVVRQALVGKEENREPVVVAVSQSMQTTLI